MLKALWKLVVVLVFVAVVFGLIVTIIDVMTTASSVIFISDYNFVIEGARTRQVEVKAVTGEILTYNLSISSIYYDVGDIQYVVETRGIIFHILRSVELHLQRK